MLFYFYVFVFIISLIALGVSSGMVVRSLLKLSRVLGINESVITLIFLGVAVSVPETFIAIISIIFDVPLLSLGNILGANLANITLVLGSVAALSNGITLSTQISKRVFIMSSFLSVLPSLVIFGGGASRMDGLLFLAIFIIYLMLFSYDSEYLKKTAPHLPYGVHYFSEIYPSLKDIFTGLAILILSAIFIVLFTIGLANYWAVNILFFGAIILGLITTLPELFLGIRGAFFRHPALAVGSVLGSMVFNGTLIIGILSIFSPTTIRSDDGGPIILTAVFTLTALIFFGKFSYTGARISRLEGVLLMSLYLLFLASSLFLFL